MGGYTRYLPQEDRYIQTRKQFEAMIATAMGGRSAELLKFSEVTTGASNDIDVATRIARQMVTRYGMSDKLGPRSLGKRQEAIFLGRELTEERDYSLKTENIIDAEVDRLLGEGKQNADRILGEHMDQLDRLSQYLLENETIEGEDMKSLLQGTLVAPRPPAAAAPEPQVAPAPAGPQPRPLAGTEPQAL
jgi:cell division protease FtsH